MSDTSSNDLSAMNDLSTRVRVISDNDYAGDPDGLVQLAHQALSPSAELVGVIGSHLPVNPAFDPNQDTADRAVAEARIVLNLAGASDVPVHAGSNLPLTNRKTPIDTPGALALITAARADDPRPLFACFGGGLTELASAWLMAPEIADRLTVIWIGGAEYPGIATPPPGASAAEFNTIIDPVAAQVVFEDSNLRVWQVPRDAYRTVLVSMADLREHLAGVGALGSHLFDRLEQASEYVRSFGMHPGETFVLGDSPMVSLSTLHSTFEPDPSSSPSLECAAPRIGDDGRYVGSDTTGKTVRVFTRMDTSLIVRDLYAKVAAWARETSAKDTL